MYIKVCCISSVEEANMAISMGVTGLGFVSFMPSGPGILDLKTIKAIIEHVPDSIMTFLLTSETTTSGIIDQLQYTGANTVQLVHEVNSTVLEELRDALPEIQIIQVIHVLERDDIQRAQLVSPYVDALLLDSGKPQRDILGGTGQIHDWSISAAICAQATVPVYLAGGLSPNNIKQAIADVQPDGVDVCSGVRRDDMLHYDTLKAFVDDIKLHQNN